MCHTTLHPLDTAPDVLRTCDLVPNSLRRVTLTRSTAHRPTPSPTPRHWPRAQYSVLALLQIDVPSIEPHAPPLSCAIPPRPPHIASFGVELSPVTIRTARRWRFYPRSTGSPPAFGFFAGAIAQGNLVEFGYASTYSEYFTIEPEVDVAAGRFVVE
ncbi:hypothetical protein B0H19DRAFT_1385115 [Mycena capillaripes]|nr:hypothetical protein B0H19DRAFT_1385115 [Mycena capillaripes]